MRAKRDAFNTPRRKLVRSGRVAHAADGAERYETVERRGATVPEFVQGSALVDGRGDTSV